MTKLEKTMRRMVCIIFSCLIIFSSCDQSKVGIFFSLENVVKIAEENRGLHVQAPIKSFVELGSHYYLTTSTLKVRTRGVNTSGNTGYEWKAVGPPSSNYTIALKVDKQGGNIITHFASDGPADNPHLSTAIFQSSGEITYNNAGNAGWTNITPSLSSGERISNFFVVNDVLIVEIQTVHRDDNRGSYSYQLHNVANNIKIGTVQVLPYIDSEYDGSAYWFISQDKVFSSSDITAATLTELDTSRDPFVEGGTALKPVDTAANLRIFNFSGLGKDSSNTLFLVAQSGYIFTHSGGTWTTLKRNGSSAIRFSDVGTNRTHFTDMLSVPARFTGNEQLYVSSTNEGYSFIDMGNDTVVYLDPGMDHSDTNFFSTSIYNGHVSSLYYAETENVLFALTARNSLWRASYANGYLTWHKE